MTKEIISNLHIKVTKDNNSYDITYYEIPNYTFIKCISKTVEFSDAKGFGHFVTETLSESKEGNIFFSTTPHNEIKSSALSVTKLMDDMDSKDHLKCAQLTSEIYALLRKGEFSKNAKTIEETQSARRVFDDICTKYYLRDMPILKELK